MPEPILPLYNAMLAAGVESADAEKRAIEAKAKHEAATAALFDAMPEHVEFSTDPTPPSFLRRVGNKIEAVTPQSMHAVRMTENGL